MAATRYVADLGNSRLKWAALGPDGRPGPTSSLPADDPDAWLDAWPADGAGSAWAVASVNPPAAAQLEAFLRERGVESVAWYRSAADVPIRHDLESARTAGADRALAVLAAGRLRPGRPGVVVLCGTALTVERVDADGTWRGGAIAPGLAVAADALHRLTAQLPRVEPGPGPPPAFGRSTIPALSAGLFWGIVGSARELVARQSAGLGPGAWVVWSGGDAPRIAPEVAADPEVVPDLVLAGLALAWPTAGP